MSEASSCALDSLRESARSLGAIVEDDAPRLLIRTRAGRDVTFALVGADEPLVSVAVTASRPHAGVFVVRRPVHWSHPQAASRVRTGDVRFDGVLACHGRAPDIHTLTGPDERRLLLQLFARHGVTRCTIAPRRIRAHAPLVDAERLTDLVHRLVTLSELFGVREGGLLGRLLTKTIEDRAPRARAIAAERLFARVIVGSEAERIACEHMALADGLLPRLRVDAMIRLRRHDPERVLPTMRRLLESPAPAVVADAVRYVGEVEDFESSARVVRCAKDADLDVRQAAAWTLGRLGGDAAEVALIELAPTTREAVEALGLVGGHRAVAALRPLTRGVRRSASSKRTARRALGAIKERVGPAGRGRLAIVWDAGALSTAVLARPDVEE